MFLSNSASRTSRDKNTNTKLLRKMKFVKILAVGALALAVSSAASAATIRITGSTAFRKALYAGIVDQLGSGTVTAAFVGTAGNIASSNQVVFTNGTDTIYCCMAGSSGGLNWTSHGLTVATDKDRTDPGSAWLKPSLAAATCTLTSPSAGITGGTPLGSPTADDPAVYEAPAAANVTMADTAQNATQWSSLLGNPALTKVGAALGEQQYVFAKGKQYDNVAAASYNRLTNMTPLAFQQLAANGVANLALFTGNASDTGVDVVLVGRDNDSGTRCVTNYESGYGTDQTTMVQYRAIKADNVTDVGIANSGPIDHFVDADTLSVGNPGLNGYASGGFVKNVLNAAGTTTTGVLSPNGNPAIVIGYVSTGDIPAAAQILSYNGVQLYPGGVQNPVLSEQGQYSFWNPEVMYQKGISGVTLTLATNVATKIRNADVAASGGIKTTDMACSRTNEGAPISHN